MLVLGFSHSGKYFINIHQVAAPAVCCIFAHLSWFRHKICRCCPRAILISSESFMRKAVIIFRYAADQQTHATNTRNLASYHRHRGWHNNSEYKQEDYQESIQSECNRTEIIQQKNYKMTNCLFIKMQQWRREMSIARTAVQETPSLR